MHKTEAGAAGWGLIVFLGAVVFGVGGCATPSMTTGTGPGETGAAPVSEQRRQVVRVASQQIGTPYRYGGSSREGFDCSGLVQYTHREIGIEVPRTTRSQWKQARTPERDYLMPGDLLFFRMGTLKDRHVGIYEGNGLFIHAPSSGKRVSRSSLGNPFWQRRLLGAKSFL
jgi:cell wall-associated NlpC family hydrolase